MALLVLHLPHAGHGAGEALGERLVDLVQHHLRQRPEGETNRKNGRKGRQGLIYPKWKRLFTT